MCRKNLLSAFLILLCFSCHRLEPEQGNLNLVPEALTASPDYWCTWGAQNYAADTLSLINTLSPGGHTLTAGYLTLKQLLGKEGWSHAIPEILRKDLILVFDVGWDIVAGEVLNNAVAISKFSYFLSTYDITQQLLIPSTLDRVTEVLYELSGSASDVILNCEGEPPYVICSRHLNGAMAVATLPRVSSDSESYYPLADISLQIDDPYKPIGIFGRYRSLKLNLGRIIEPDKITILAQDLASDKADEIGDQIQVNTDHSVIPGELITREGLAAGLKWDLSEPGIEMKIQQNIPSMKTA